MELPKIEVFINKLYYSRLSEQTPYETRSLKNIKSESNRKNDDAIEFLDDDPIVHFV